MKTLYREMLLFIPVFFLRLLGLLLIISTTVNLNLNGFAVSEGKVYVGLSNRVEIWEDNYCTGKVSLWKYPFDGYVFCLENDQIAIYTSLEKRTLDMSGNLLDTQEYDDTRILNAKENQKETYTDADGVTYTQKSIFGYYYIVNQQTQKVVYRMPVFDYSVKAVQNILNVVIFVLVTYIICKGWKSQTGKGRNLIARKKNSRAYIHGCINLTRMYAC